MRPDTEPNIHAKRIMTGALVITLIAGGSYIAMWLNNNYTTVAHWLMLLTVTAITCYSLGTVALGMYDG